MADQPKEPTTPKKGPAFKTGKPTQYVGATNHTYTLEDLSNPKVLAHLKRVAPEVLAD